MKISENKTATFKIKKYDDLFLTISLFCEIYSIDEKIMKPFIIKSLSALNTIYQIYNSDISQENIEILKTIKNFDDTKWINDEANIWNKKYLLSILYYNNDFKLIYKV